MPLAFLGIYTIAAFIPTVIEAPLVAFEKIASAKIAYAWSVDDRKQINEIYHQSSLYLFLLGAWLFLMINGNTNALYTFLPTGYDEGKWVVLIISVGTLFNMATGLNAPILFNSERYRYGAFFLIALAIIVLALQMWLIPLYGLEGAAMATAAASIAYNTMLLITVWRLFGLQPFDARNLKVLAVFVFTYTCSFQLPHIANPYLSIACNSLLLSVVYAAGIHWLKIVPELEQQVFNFITVFRKRT
jgi:O-antigen/teichoic acid export membrane protein